jgi:hypothetical protein
MAEKGPAKKIGPLPVYGWAAVGGGTYLAYYLYKQHSSNVNAAQTAAANGTVGGVNPLPLDPALSGVASTSSVATDPFQTWRTSVLSALQAQGLSQSAAITALNDYLAGQAIPNATSANVLKNVLGTIGLAPGYGYLPVTAAKTAPPVTTTHTPSETHVTTPNTGGGGSRPATVSKVVAATPATPYVRPRGGAAGPNLLSTPIPYNVNGKASKTLNPPNNKTFAPGNMTPTRLQRAQVGAAQTLSGPLGPVAGLFMGADRVVGWATSTFGTAIRRGY